METAMNYLPTQDPKLRSIATPNHPPSPPPQTRSHALIFTFLLVFLPKQQSIFEFIKANLTPVFYLSVKNTPPPLTSPLSPRTPALKAGQGRSHCTFQLPGTLVEEKAIQKADSTIKAIWKLLLYYALLRIRLLERTLSKSSQCSRKLWRFDHD